MLRNSSPALDQSAIQPSLSQGLLNVASRPEHYHRHERYLLPDPSPFRQQAGVCLLHRLLEAFDRYHRTDSVCNSVIIIPEYSSASSPPLPTTNTRKQTRVPHPHFQTFPQQAGVGHPHRTTELIRSAIPSPLSRSLLQPAVPPPRR